MPGPAPGGSPHPGPLNTPMGGIGRQLLGSQYARSSTREISRGNMIYSKGLGGKKMKIYEHNLLKNKNKILKNWFFLHSCKYM